MEGQIRISSKHNQNQTWKWGMRTMLRMHTIPHVNPNSVYLLKSATEQLVKLQII